MGTRYDDFYHELKQNVQKKGKGHSSSDRLALMHGLINEPEQTCSRIVAESNNPTVVEIQPTKKYREALKKMTESTFGISPEESAKLDTASFTKDHAKAIIDLADQSMMDYLSTGRGLNLPMTDKTSSQMTIRMEQAAEKIEDTNKIVQQPDGKYASVPTGKTIKTDTHSVLKAKNKVPAWLKSEI